MSDTGKHFDRDSLANPVGDLNCAGKRSLWEDDGELFSSVTGSKVDVAAVIADRLSDGSNDHVTAGMTEAVVHLF